MTLWHRKGDPSNGSTAHSVKNLLSYFLFLLLLYVFLKVGTFLTWFGFYLANLPGSGRGRGPGNGDPLSKPCRKISLEAGWAEGLQTATLLSNLATIRKLVQKRDVTARIVT